MFVSLRIPASPYSDDWESYKHHGIDSGSTTLVTAHQVDSGVEVCADFLGNEVRIRLTADEARGLAGQLVAPTG